MKRWSVEKIADGRWAAWDSKPTTADEEMDLSKIFKDPQKANEAKPEEIYPFFGFSGLNPERSHSKDVLIVLAQEAVQKCRDLTYGG